MYHRTFACVFLSGNVMILIDWWVDCLRAGVLIDGPGQHLQTWSWWRESWNCTTGRFVFCVWSELLEEDKQLKLYLTVSFFFFSICVFSLQSSFVGAIAIGDLVKSTLGPKGMVGHVNLSSWLLNVLWMFDWHHSWIIKSTNHCVSKLCRFPWWIKSDFDFCGI